MTLQEDIQRIKEVMGIHEDMGSIVLYHGTPFAKSATEIMKNGLKTKGDFIKVGGSEFESMQGRSYLTSELWNAIRYSFMQPDWVNKDWESYIKEEPYGYVFEFENIKQELLPDEDAIGSIVNKFLVDGENSFIKKYLDGIDQELTQEVKDGSFEAFAKVGKIIEPKLTEEDRMNVINNSFTFTTDKNMAPIRLYKIKKPPIKFFNKQKDYIKWFTENSEEIDIK